ncbi:MAG: DJ-1/PfpI family protein [Patescibacteria group bacterium]
MSALLNKKILIIIAPQGFQDKEYGDTRQVLEEQGAQIIVGSLKLGEALGNLGAKAKIDILAEDANPDNFDAAAFIGGQGMVELVEREEFTDLARRFYENNKLTAAICIAPMILAHAQILQGKKATVWPEAKKNLIALGANYTAKPVEVDGKIITANGPKAASAFGKAIAKILTSNS